MELKCAHEPEAEVMIAGDVWDDAQRLALVLQGKASEEIEIHSEAEKISGLVPSEINAEAEYHEHLLKKHR